MEIYCIKTDTQTFLRKKNTALSKENQQFLVCAKNVWWNMFPLSSISPILFSLPPSLNCNLFCSHTLPVILFSMFQWPGGHSQSIYEQQHWVAGGVYGVFWHEERHSFWALWTHCHLLPLLPSCQEVSHLQRSGPVKNKGITGSTATGPIKEKKVIKREPILYLSNLSLPRSRSALSAQTKRQPCCSSPVVTCALVRVSHLTFKHYSLCVCTCV